MKYRLFGKSGLRVSEIALGTMTIGNAWGWGSEKEVALEILKKYSDLGGNFIDTACNYQDTQSEKIIGEFLKGDRDRYVVATKYTLHDHRYLQDPNAGGNHRKNLLRTVRDSLERLQTDYIDVLYLHVWDGTTGLYEIMRTLNDLVSSTKVNYIAISDTPAWIAARANTIAELRGWEPFSGFQFQYSLINREPEREIIPFCNQTDVAMTSWGTLGSGLLTGKYTRNESSSGRLNRNSEIPAERLALAKEVDSIADELGVTSAQTAIRWVMQQGGVQIPIVGATSPNQLEDSLQATDIELTEESLKRLGSVVKFSDGFPVSMIKAPTVKSLIHGESYEKLEVHRQSPYF